jgi:DNA-directed RNA polymerase specialized sigma24 family protein
MERAELVGQVRGAIAALAGRQRLALELQVEDRSYREIAHRLALSPEATKSLLYRARQQMKERLVTLVS